MKSMCRRIIVTLLGILIVVSVVSVKSGHRSGARAGTALPAAPVLPASAYSELVNGMTMGGR